MCRLQRVYHMEVRVECANTDIEVGVGCVLGIKE